MSDNASVPQPEFDIVIANAARDLQRFQVLFDDVNWTSSKGDEAKRRHIGFHLTIAAGKLARVEERLDHGEGDDSIIFDVAADLLVYALQLATLKGENLADLYFRRLDSINARSVSHDTFGVSSSEIANEH